MIVYAYSQEARDWFDKEICVFSKHAKCAWMESTLTEGKLYRYLITADNTVKDEQLEELYTIARIAEGLTWVKEDEEALSKALEEEFYSVKPSVDPQHGHHFVNYSTVDISAKVELCKQFFNNYGKKHIVVLVSEKFNCKLKMFSTQAFAVGDKLQICGVVKHSTFAGKPETHIKPNNVKLST